MSEIINLATYRARKAAAKPADRHMARVIFQFDHELEFDDLAAMLSSLEVAGRHDIAAAIHECAVVVQL